MRFEVVMTDYESFAKAVRAVRRARKLLATDENLERASDLVHAITSGGYDAATVGFADDAGTAEAAVAVLSEAGVHSKVEKVPSEADAGLLTPSEAPEAPILPPEGSTPAQLALLAMALANGNPTAALGITNHYHKITHNDGFKTAAELLLATFPAPTEGGL